MPIKSCSANGKAGKKYGYSGKCYTGAAANSKAVKQMKAIKANQKKG